MTVPRKTKVRSTPDPKVKIPTHWVANKTRILAKGHKEWIVVERNGKEFTLDGKKLLKHDVLDYGDDFDFGTYKLTLEDGSELVIRGEYWYRMEEETDTSYEKNAAPLCDQCKGTGKADGQPYCSTCGGAGYMVKDVILGPDQRPVGWLCYECKQAGRFPIFKVHWDSFQSRQTAAVWKYNPEADEPDLVDESFMATYVIMRCPYGHEDQDGY
jgi:hypothetical protein